MTVAITADARVPAASALRLVGPAAEDAKKRIALPLGAKLSVDAETLAVTLGPNDVGDVSSVARALPDPDTLDAGTLLFVLPSVIDPPSLGSRFLAALGRGKTVPRVLRSSALVSRGYVRVSAGVDRETRTDLVWGYVPPDERAITERD